MLTEEKIQEEKLLDALDEIPLGRMYKAAFRALMRLQVWFTGRTHELMLDFSEDAQAVILKAAGSPTASVADASTLDPSSAFSAQTAINTIWGDTWKEWMDAFLQVREESAQIAFGVQAEYHDRLIVPAVENLDDVEEAHDLSESAVTDAIYDPQLRILMQVTQEYIYGDGLNLSGRIWRIDREARDGINSVLMNGVQNGSSAWDIAKNLEQFLGAGQDCPRWAKNRLYGMTSKEKTTSAKGLFSGVDCKSSGVSYKAIRLARSEIQKIHNLANDRMMSQEPWVREEQIHLSVAHPEEDICDDVVEGGRDGQGIYSVGEIELPLHPECLCYKTAVLIAEKEFTSDLNGWLKGEKDYPEMDAYAADLGVDLDTSLKPAAINLAVWLLSNELDGWMK